jgi:ADP-heptose:LPS heptosyltransferase
MEGGPANTRLEEMIRALTGAKTVAIVRLGSIGDVIATLPFAWFMRDFLHSETRIVWIAHPAAGNLIRGVKALDEVVMLPRGPIGGRFPSGAAPCAKSVRTQYSISTAIPKAGSSLV